MTVHWSPSVLWLTPPGTVHDLSPDEDQQLTVLSEQQCCTGHWPLHWPSPERLVSKLCLFFGYRGQITPNSLHGSMNGNFLFSLQENRLSTSHHHHSLIAYTGDITSPCIVLIPSTSKESPFTSIKSCPSPGHGFSDLLQYNIYTTLVFSTRTCAIHKVLMSLNQVSTTHRNMGEMILPVGTTQTNNRVTH